MRPQATHRSRHGYKVRRHVLALRTMKEIKKNKRKLPATEDKVVANSDKELDNKEIDGSKTAKKPKNDDKEINCSEPARIPRNDDEEAVKERKREKRRRKKERKRKQKEENQSTSEDGVKDESKAEDGENIAMNQALIYLRTWYKTREQWTFQKVRQVWLLQHMYDVNQVNSKCFKRLLAYMDGMKGQARAKTIETANKMMDTESVSTGEEETEAAHTEEQLDRAKRVLQRLT